MKITEQQHALVLQQAQDQFGFVVLCRNPKPMVIGEVVREIDLHRYGGEGKLRGAMARVIGEATYAEYLRQLEMFIAIDPHSDPPDWDIADIQYIKVIAE